MLSESESRYELRETEDGEVQPTTGQDELPTMSLLPEEKAEDEDPQSDGIGPIASAFADKLKKTSSKRTMRRAVSFRDEPTAQLPPQQIQQLVRCMSVNAPNVS